MKNLTIPPAPVGAARPKPQTQSKPHAPASPLDAAFVARVYRSMLWFGLVCTALAAFAFPSVAGVGSFVGGLVLSAVLLRLQEIGVRALLQPKEKLMGMDARLAIVLLLPLKFVGVAVFLVVFNAVGLLRAGPLALGFTVGIVVLLAKFAGWMIVRARALNQRFDSV